MAETKAAKRVKLGPVRLKPGMSLADGGSFGVYRVTCSCNWRSHRISPATSPVDWRDTIENHVCAASSG
jgi:hypothetical protein